jgi:hypothetical protein
MKTFRMHISSPAASSLKDVETWTLDDMGFDEVQWNKLTEEEKEHELDEYAKELLFNWYIEYTLSTQES